MAYYIHKGAVIQNEQPTDEIKRSFLLEEQETAFVIMSEEMLFYWKENPTSTPEEIYNLGANLELN